MKRLAAAGALLLLSGCSSLSLPPRHADDACRVLAQRPQWQHPLLRAEARWQVSPSIIMATVYHESSFRPEARPRRIRYLGFIPGPRPSSAYGYAQAIDGTWDEYRQREGRGYARRDDFADAVDFIGWYHQGTRQSMGAAADDMRMLYLTYHEGRNGYRAGRHLQKPWLLAYTDKVVATEARYREQLASCLLPPQP